MKRIDQFDSGWLRSAVQTPSGPAPCLLAVGTARPDLFEFNALSDAVLLRWLTSDGPRPNTLIQCAPGALDTAMRHLMTWSALPFRVCSFPGVLELPDPPRGTVLLKEVGALTLSQQVVLYDWLSAAHRSVQVVSLTTISLEALVEDGEFLEGLLYRLNVVRIDGVAGTRPAPLDTWAISVGQRAS